MLFLGFLGIAACDSGSGPGAGKTDSGPGPTDGGTVPADSGPGPAPPDGAPAADATGGSCVIEQLAPPDQGAAHVAECVPVTHATKPPSGGNHYPTWPVFRVYDKPVPWGFLVHGMEHGVVVIAHNCSNCEADIAAAKKLWMDTPPKGGCPRPPVIVTPDPTLDVPFAAAAWGHILRARCFDREAFAAFIADHANHGPELFPGDCGYADKEAVGWCP